MPEPLPVAARDGHPLAADLFTPESSPDAAVLIAPAMGVPRRFYAPFAAHLAGAGLAALTLDLRGTGGSRRGRLRGFEASLHGWGELDLAGAVDALAARFPGKPLLWVGHSAGGQLLGLVDDRRLAAALLVGAQSGHWRLWRGFGRAVMAALWWVAIPAVVKVVGYLPLSRLSRGEDVPAGVALEWAAWGRHRDYILSYAGARGGMGFARFSGPIRSYAVADDRYAPPAAVEALLEAFSRARGELRVVTPGEVGVARLGHFGFFRPRHEPTLWAEAAAWLRTAAAAPRSPAVSAARSGRSP